MLLSQYDTVSIVENAGRLNIKHDQALGVLLTDGLTKGNRGFATHLIGN